ncbi:hypothetical protein B0T13DRAFT_232364 [Neurospora crassa]|nr:hypothetical protein B0T13DRAFT_232364 [Neurospora crassa]
MAAAHLSTPRHPRLELKSGRDDGTYNDNDDQVYDKQCVRLGLVDTEPCVQASIFSDHSTSPIPPCASRTCPISGTHRHRCSLASTAGHSEETFLLRPFSSRRNSINRRANPPPSQLIHNTFR